MEYISREAVLRLFSCDLGEKDSRVSYQGMCIDAAMRIAKIPAEDVRLVKRGFNKLKDYPSLFECSVCGWGCGDTVPGDTETYNYCPNCGADMREKGRRKRRKFRLIIKKDRR